ncbi:MAG: DivIVA domain-containing protein [Deltaproteobacteria bacterium]|nr:DivIVA domain-containing protein [Deltaproteobacteria bacterium]
MKTDKTEILSDCLTPVEIKNKDFKKSVWGYSPHEVIPFLDSVAKTWERVQKHEKVLLEEIRILNAELTGWKNREAQIGEIEAKARGDAEKTRQEGQKEAEKIIFQAREQARQLREKVEAWLEQIFAAVDNTEKMRQAFLGSLKGTLDQHYALLNTENDGTSLTLRLTELLQEAKAQPTPPVNQ